jgi:outer membrane putative beta-barrel porin/alpha-amylase
MTRWCAAALVGLGLMLVANTALAAEELDWTVGASLYPQYAFGRYGTSHTTHILYVPLIVEWAPTDRLELRLTTPYLWERGRTIVALIGGGSVESAQRVAVQRRDQRRHDVTEEGLGDIVLEGEYALTTDHDRVPEISPFAQIKFPTADSRRGLGTGEFDETFGVTLTKSFAKNWTVYLEGSYTIVGSPAQTHLDNSIGWVAGLGYDVTRSLNLAGYVEGATTASARGDDSHDLRVELKHQLTKHWALLAGTIVGLSHASSTFGVSAGLRFRF